LPSSFNYPEAWYSLQNKEKVNQWRSFYRQILTLFGGDHVLYVNERTIDNLYDTTLLPSSTCLSNFENSLISKYGKTVKSIFGFPKSKLPKYYIDYFVDL
jgi:hypothetical protein